MKKNKLKLIISMLALSMLLFSSCEDDSITEVALSDITLSQSEIQLSIEEVQAITVEAAPVNATENVTWTSSDSSVAEIQFNEAGLVAGIRGVSLGAAILTATSQDGSVSKTIEVEVIVKVESIALEEEAIENNPAQTRYKVVFTPEDATYQAVIWNSSDSGVASVIDGLITAVSEGVSIITATTIQGEKTASVEIVTSGDPPVLGLQYCSVSGTGSYNADTIVTIGADADINHSEGQPANNYGYYENEILIVQPGNSFDLSLVHSNTWSMSLVYVDWNGDKDFLDEGEIVQQFGLPSQLNDGPFNATINVPLDAAIGKIRMRILTGDAWTTDPIGEPCGEYANSTTKDFDIEIGGVVYCSAIGSKSYNADEVKTTGGDTNINHSGGQPVNNYGIYPEEVLSISGGGTFNLSVTNSNGWSRSIVWIDWNADGDFEDVGEQLTPLSEQKLYSGDPAIAYAMDVTVPNDAILGITRMRILTGDAWVYNDDMSGLDPDGPGIPIAPCGELNNSTIKDFIIKVL